MVALQASWLKHLLLAENATHVIYLTHAGNLVLYLTKKCFMEILLDQSDRLWWSIFMDSSVDHEVWKFAPCSFTGLHGKGCDLNEMKQKQLSCLWNLRKDLKECDLIQWNGLEYMLWSKGVDLITNGRAKINVRMH